MQHVRLWLFSFSAVEAQRNVPDHELELAPRIDDRQELEIRRASCGSDLMTAKSVGPHSPCPCVVPDLGLMSFEGLAAPAIDQLGQLNKMLGRKVVMIVPGPHETPPDGR